MATVNRISYFHKITLPLQGM